MARRSGYGGWVRLARDPAHPACGRMVIDGRAFREVGEETWNPARRLDDCDRFGVTMQVLSTVPVMFAYWAKPEHALDLARMLNDHVAGVVRESPARFAGLGTLPLQSPDLAARELERCVRQLGLRGAQIGSHVNGKNLDDPALFPVFETAQALDAAIFVHPWDMLAKERMERYWLPWLVGMPCETALAICSVVFGGVLERLPRLRLGFAHGGGAFPALFGRVQRGFEARPDLCAVANPHPPRRYLDRLFMDSLVHHPAALRLLLDLVGAERVALGSDYPFPLGEARPGEMIDAMPDLSVAQRERMLCGTAREFLNLAAAVPAREEPGRATSGQP